MIKYILSLIFAYTIVYCLIPQLCKFAAKVDFVDKPTERKRHKEPIPLLGGVGIYIGFLCGYIIFTYPLDIKSAAILIASSFILAIGLVDDWYKTHGKEFPILPRLLIHILSATIVYKAGIVFSGFLNPFTNQYVILPGWLQFALTITWIFGVTTVINFSDGMDGLAGSLSSISGWTLFIVALVKGQPYSAIMAILLVGATLGFLQYNKHPAKIFMGDSGANFIGFILAIIALDGAFKHATLISICIPILTLGVPIFDNIFVVIKRFLDGKPIYKADTSQVHYRLLSTGLNQKQVVSFLSLINTCFSLVAIIILLLKI